MLTVSADAYAALRQHGEDVYPEESCGVLAGRFEGEAAVVVSAFRCVNARRDAPRNRYTIDPKELIEVQREIRERGLDIVGFYHSHPDHPAQWSATDLDEACWVHCAYVITSVERGRAGETRAFRLVEAVGSLADYPNDKQFIEEEVVQQASI